MAKYLIAFFICFLSYSILADSTVPCNVDVPGRGSRRKDVKSMDECHDFTWTVGHEFCLNRKCSEPEPITLTFSIPNKSDSWVFGCHEACDNGASGTCDPINQPYPDFQVRKGKCLDNCAHLGGTGKYNGCGSDEDEIGPSWDYVYCCKKKGGGGTSGSTSGTNTGGTTSGTHSGTTSGGTTGGTTSSGSHGACLKYCDEHGLQQTHSPCTPSNDECRKMDSSMYVWHEVGTGPWTDGKKCCVGVYVGGNGGGTPGEDGGHHTGEHQE